MPAFIDLTGKKFGRLTVLSFNPQVNGVRATWNCKCDCGKESKVCGNNLRIGMTKSCGCIWLEEVAGSNRSHGKINTPEYKAWGGMKARCYNENIKNFGDYGGRGIVVCDRWLNSFENFYKDMGDRPTPKHSIDRIENDRGYSKENCRWATRKEQCENRRSNIFIEKDGIRLTVSQWAVKLNIEAATIHARVKRGISVEQQLETVNLCEKYYEYNGTKLSVTEWINQLGIGKTTFYRNLKLSSFPELVERFSKSV